MMSLAEMVAVQVTSKKPLTSYGKGFFTLTMTYDKPYKTYQEQLKIIKSRNINIDNEDFAYRF